MNRYGQGDKLKDEITGFEGTVTAITLFYNGCIQYFLEPPATDGKKNEGAWIDEQQLELVEPAKPKAKESESKPKTGGGFREMPK